MEAAYTIESNLDALSKIVKYDWRKSKKYAFVRLINKKLAEHGVGDYEGVWYKKCLDFAQIVYFQEKHGDNYITYILKEKDFEDFRVTPEQAFRDAQKNTVLFRKKRIYPFRQDTIINTTLFPLLELPKGPLPIGTKSASISGPLGLLEDVDEDGKENILVVSNKSNPFGGAHIVEKETLDEVYDRFGENFYIIPLSIHKGMFIRNSYMLKNKTYEEANDDISDMLRGMNRDKSTGEDEVLSYKIYQYFGDENGIVMPVFL